MDEEMDFSDWVAFGIKKGWCGPPVCYPHDGIPSSLEEDEAYEEGNDPCMHIIRLYEDDEQRRAVTENHSPSQWRNHYT